MKYTYLLLTLILLTACSTTGSSLPGPSTSNSPVSNTGLDKVKTKVDVPARLLQPCGYLTTIPLGASLDDLMDAHRKDVLVHGECSANNTELIKLMKSAFNLD